MADRDLLPDTFKADHYDLKLTNLDFKDWSYNGSVTYESCPSLATPDNNNDSQAEHFITGSRVTSPSPPRRLSSIPSS
jgi:hypothetical protein